MVMCENVTELKCKCVPMNLLPPPHSDQLIPGHDLTKTLCRSGSLLSITPEHSGKLKMAELKKGYSGWGALWFSFKEEVFGCSAYRIC